VSLYGINLIPNRQINHQFSVANLKKIIQESNANIDGRLTGLNENPQEKTKPEEIDKKRYVAMLSESTASVSIFPKQKYASFFLSTFGLPNPVLSLDLLISLFLL
jgi:hypothetical protein